MSESSMREMISEVSPPFSSSSPRVLKAEKERLCTDQSAITCLSFASISFSLTALMQMSSMSSLCSRRGASMMLRREKVSDSTSNVCFVTLAILSQWRSFMDRLAISSRRGQHSLKSSIFCFKSLNACHSFKPFGSLRHLWMGNMYSKHRQITHITKTTVLWRPCTEAYMTVNLLAYSKTRQAVHHVSMLAAPNMQLYKYK